MSHYPEDELNRLAKVLTEQLTEHSPRAGTAGKSFNTNFDCRPIFLDDRVLWVSEECLKDEDDGPDTVENAAVALRELDLVGRIGGPFVRELLLTHRDQSTPGDPAKVLASWGSWRLVEPSPSVRTSLS